MFMKVLMISEYFPPMSMGGGEISAFLLAKELAKNNIDITILTSKFSGQKEDETIEGVRVLRRLKTGLPYSLKGQIDRERFFEKSVLRQSSLVKDYDIIHCMNTDSLVAIKLKKFSKAKFVMHVNGPSVFCPKRTLMYKDDIECNKKCHGLIYLNCITHSKYAGKTDITIQRYNPAFIYYIKRKHDKINLLMKQFDYYTPISTYMQERLIKEGIDKEKTKVIYNILEIEKFKTLNQQKNKTKKLLYLGAYTKPKGPQLVLEAINGLKDYEINFYGTGPLKQALVDYAKKNKLNANIYDEIKYTEVPEKIAQHDILVFPSIVAEAFGRVALEAIAAGKTVVASDIGGIPDIVRENQSGYLFEMGNSEDLRAKIKKAIEKPLDKKKLVSFVDENFSKDIIIQNILNVYRRLLDGQA